MADENRELWRYELNITDVEAKIARLQQLGADLQARRGRGEDTSAIEEQLGKEAAGFSDLFVAKGKDADATKHLLQQKEKLAHVVRLLGGQFGGLLGPLGSAAELMFTMGPAMAGIAAGVAGVTILAAAWKSVADEAERAKKAIDEANAARLEQLGQAFTEDQQIVAGLEKLGARSPENLNAVLKLRADLMQQFGFGQENAQAGAIAAVGAGAGLEDAAVLARIMAQGVQVSSLADAQRTLQKARDRGDYEGLLAAARAQTQDTVGQENQRRGAVARTDAFAPATIEAVFTQGLASGAVGKDVSLADFTKRMETFRDRERLYETMGVEPNAMVDTSMAGLFTERRRTKLREELVRDAAAFALYEREILQRAGVRGAPSPGQQPKTTPAVPFDPEAYKPQTGRATGAPSLEEAAAQMRAKHVGNGVVIHAQTIQMVGDARRANVDNRPRLTPAGLDDGGPF